MIDRLTTMSIEERRPSWRKARRALYPSLLVRSTPSLFNLPCRLVPATRRYVDDGRTG
jgi:hypothetical protein